MICPQPAFRQPSYEALLQHEAAQTKQLKAAQTLESMPRSELTTEEYATDDFRMFHFKVARCCKRYVHDWRDCPFAHSTENARRRDPRECGYLPIACPNYKGGFCLEGDECLFAHGVYECWLHPAKYRTQMCKDMSGCTRDVCFFAHTPTQLRRPHLSTAKAEREVFAKLGVSSLEELGLEDWSQLLSPGSPNSVSGFHHFEGLQHDQSMSPVLQQYLMQQKHQHTGPAISRAPVRAPETNRPRMSNAMARHLGVIPAKDHRHRLQGDAAALASSFAGLTAAHGALPSAYNSYGLPQAQGFLPADAFTPMPIQAGLMPSAMSTALPTETPGYHPEQSNELLQLASHLNYFNLAGQAGLQAQPGQALNPSVQGGSLQRMSSDSRMSLDHLSMASGQLSLDGNHLGSLRSQLSTCLGFPAAGPVTECSGSLMSSSSMISTSLGNDGFAPRSQPLPVQRPRRNASGPVYWL